jgi:alpha-tubulin suppressor-like RCC1 family protein
MTERSRAGRDVPLIRSLLAVLLLAALVDVVASGGAQAASASVYQWGFNSGQTHLSPGQVTGLPSRIVAVQAANWGGMALDSKGNVWDWGTDKVGALGDGLRRSSPNIAVRAIGPTHVVSIGEGNNFGAAVDRAGNLWTWGWNHYLQLCQPGVRVALLPREVAGIGPASAVSGGGGHLLILLANGTVDACGLNSHGELGDGKTRSSSRPVPVENLTNVVAVSAGNMFSAALESNGSVWTWGYDKFGQLGVGSTANMAVPHEVKLPAPATQIYVGGDYPNDGHMIVLLSTGEVMAWGDNSCGQLGIGTGVTNATTPVAVDVPSGVSFSYVAAGGEDSFAIDSAGGLWAWGGRPGAGDLGNGTSGGSVVFPKKIGSGFTLLSATANEGVGYSTGP